MLADRAGGGEKRQVLHHLDALRMAEEGDRRARPFCRERAQGGRDEKRVADARHVDDKDAARLELWI